MRDNKSALMHDFGTLEAEAQSVAKLLPEGEHVVTITDVTFDHGNGFKVGGVLQFTDKMPQVKIECASEDGRTITIWDALRSVKRINEIDADDLPDPSEVGVDPKKWKVMQLAEKIEASFTSYTDSEGNEIAVRLVMDEDSGELVRGERIHLDHTHERTQKMLGKLKSIVVHAGHPEGTSFNAKNLGKLLIGKKIGVNVGAGQRNSKDKVMPKVLWTLAPEDVTTVD